MYCPRYHPTGMGWGFDLYEINCLSPWSKCYDQMTPLGLYIFTLLVANIDQIPLIRGVFSGQNEIKSPPFASREVGGAIH